MAYIKVLAVNKRIDILGVYRKIGMKAVTFMT